MYLSSTDFKALRRIFSLLSEDAPRDELCLLLGRELLALLRADYFASYVWNEPLQQYGNGLWLNMDPANLARYEERFQFESPITRLLQIRRHATLVSEVFPHDQLLRTEYFNDFLTRDGLHWGITLHAFDGAVALGDLRIWRGKQRSEFTQREKLLLDLIEPAFISALRRLKVSLAVSMPDEAGAIDLNCLSQREFDVANLVSRGLTNKEIARSIGVSPSTVQTYVQRMFEKLGVNRRSALAHLFHHVR